MKFNEYKEKLNWSSDDCELTKENLSYAAMGLSGETGEVTDYIKKVVFHSHDLSKDNM